MKRRSRMQTYQPRMNNCILVFVVCSIFLEVANGQSRPRVRPSSPIYPRKSYASPQRGRVTWSSEVDVALRRLDTEFTLMKSTISDMESRLTATLSITLSRRLSGLLDTTNKHEDRIQETVDKINHLERELYDLKRPNKEEDSENIQADLRSELSMMSRKIENLNTSVIDHSNILGVYKNQTDEQNNRIAQLSLKLGEGNQGDSLNSCFTCEQLETNFVEILGKILEQDSKITNLSKVFGGASKRMGMSLNGASKTNESSGEVKSYDYEPLDDDAQVINYEIYDEEYPLENEQGAPFSTSASVEKDATLYEITKRVAYLEEKVNSLNKTDDNEKAEFLKATIGELDERITSISQNLDAQQISVKDLTQTHKNFSKKVDDAFDAVSVTFRRAETRTAELSGGVRSNRRVLEAAAKTIREKAQEERRQNSIIINLRRRIRNMDALGLKNVVHLPQLKLLNMTINERIFDLSNEIEFLRQDTLDEDIDTDVVEEELGTLDTSNEIENLNERVAKNYEILLSVLNSSRSLAYLESEIQSFSRELPSVVKMKEDVESVINLRNLVLRNSGDVNKLHDSVDEMFSDFTKYKTKTSELQVELSVAKEHSKNLQSNQDESHEKLIQLSSDITNARNNFMIYQQTLTRNMSEAFIDIQDLYSKSQKSDDKIATVKTDLSTLEFTLEDFKRDSEVEKAQTERSFLEIKNNAQSFKQSIKRLDDTLVRVKSTTNEEINNLKAATNENEAVLSSLPQKVEGIQNELDIVKQNQEQNIVERQDVNQKFEFMERSINQQSGVIENTNNEVRRSGHLVSELERRMIGTENKIVNLEDIAENTMHSISRQQNMSFVARQLTLSNRNTIRSMEQKLQLFTSFVRRAEERLLKQEEELENMISRSVNESISIRTIKRRMQHADSNATRELFYKIAEVQQLIESLKHDINVTQMKYNAQRLKQLDFGKDLSTLESSVWTCGTDNQRQAVEIKRLQTDLNGKKSNERSLSDRLYTTENSFQQIQQISSNYGGDIQKLKDAKEELNFTSRIFETILRQTSNKTHDIKSAVESINSEIVRIGFHMESQDRNIDNLKKQIADKSEILDDQALAIDSILVKSAEMTNGIQQTESSLRNLEETKSVVNRLSDRVNRVQTSVSTHRQKLSESKNAMKRMYDDMNMTVYRLNQLQLSVYDNKRDSFLKRSEMFSTLNDMKAEISQINATGMLAGIRISRVENEAKLGRSRSNNMTRLIEIIQRSSASLLNEKVTKESMNSVTLNLQENIRKNGVMIELMKTKLSQLKIGVQNGSLKEVKHARRLAEIEGILSSQNSSIFDLMNSTRNTNNKIVVVNNEITTAKNRLVEMKELLENKFKEFGKQRADDQHNFKEYVNQSETILDTIEKNFDTLSNEHMTRFNITDGTLQNLQKDFEMIIAGKQELESLVYQMQKAMDEKSDIHDIEFRSVNDSFRRLEESVEGVSMWNSGILKKLNLQSYLHGKILEEFEDENTENDDQFISKYNDGTFFAQDVDGTSRLFLRIMTSSKIRDDVFSSLENKLEGGISDCMNTSSDLLQLVASNHRTMENRSDSIEDDLRKLTSNVTELHIDVVERNATVFEKLSDLGSLLGNNEISLEHVLKLAQKMEKKLPFIFGNISLLEDRIDEFETTTQKTHSLSSDFIHMQIEISSLRNMSSSILDYIEEKENETLYDDEDVNENYRLLDDDAMSYLLNQMNASNLFMDDPSSMLQRIYNNSENVKFLRHYTKTHHRKMETTMLRILENVTLLQSEIGHLKPTWEETFDSQSRMLKTVTNKTLRNEEFSMEMREELSKYSQHLKDIRNQVVNFTTIQNNSTIKWDSLSKKVSAMVLNVRKNNITIGKHSTTISDIHASISGLQDITKHNFTELREYTENGDAKILDQIMKIVNNTEDNINNSLAEQRIAISHIKNLSHELSNTVDTHMHLVANLSQDIGMLKHTQSASKANSKRIETMVKDFKKNVTSLREKFENLESESNLRHEGHSELILNLVNTTSLSDSRTERLFSISERQDAALFVLRNEVLKAEENQTELLEYVESLENEFSRAMQRTADFEDNSTNTFSEISDKITKVEEASSDLRNASSDFKGKMQEMSDQILNNNVNVGMLKENNLASTLHSKMLEILMSNVTQDVLNLTRGLEKLHTAHSLTILRAQIHKNETTSIIQEIGLDLENLSVKVEKNSLDIHQAENDKNEMNSRLLENITNIRVRVNDLNEGKLVMERDFHSKISHVMEKSEQLEADVENNRLKLLESNNRLDDTSFKYDVTVKQLKELTKETAEQILQSLNFTELAINERLMSHDEAFFRIDDKVNKSNNHVFILDEKLESYDVLLDKLNQSTRTNDMTFKETISNLSDDVLLLNKSFERIRESWKTTHAKHNRTIHTLRNGTRINAADIRSVLELISGKELNSANTSDKIDLISKQQLAQLEDQEENEVKMSFILEKVLNNEEKMKTNSAKNEKRLSKQDETLLRLTEQTNKSNEKLEELRLMAKQITNNSATVLDEKISGMNNNVTLLQQDFETLMKKNDRLQYKTITALENATATNMADIKSVFEQMSENDIALRNLTNNMNDLDETQLNFTRENFNLDAKILSMSENIVENTFKISQQAFMLTNMKAEIQDETHKINATLNNIGKNNELSRYELWERFMETTENTTERIETLEKINTLKEYDFKLLKARVENTVENISSLEVNIGNLKDLWLNWKGKQDDSLDDLRTKFSSNFESIQNITEIVSENKILRKNTDKRNKENYIELIKTMEKSEKNLISLTSANQDIITNSSAKLQARLEEHEKAIKNLTSLSPENEMIRNQLDNLTKSIDIFYTLDLITRQNLENATQVLSLEINTQNKAFLLLQNDAGKTKVLVDQAMTKLDENILSFRNMSRKVDSIHNGQMKVLKLSRSLELKINNSQEKTASNEENFNTISFQLRKLVNQTDRKLQFAVQQMMAYSDNSSALYASGAIGDFEEKVNIRLVEHDASILYLRNQTHKFNAKLEKASKTLLKTAEVISSLQNSSSSMQNFDRVIESRLDDVTQNVSNLMQKLNRMRESWTIAHTRHNETIHQVKNGTKYNRQNIESVLSKFARNNLYPANVSEQVELILQQQIELDENQKAIEAKLSYILDKEKETEESVMEDLLMWSGRFGKLNDTVSQLVMTTNEAFTRNEMHNISEEINDLKQSMRQLQNSSSLTTENYKSISSIIANATSSWDEKLSSAFQLLDDNIGNLKNRTSFEIKKAFDQLLNYESLFMNINAQLNWTVSNDTLMRESLEDLKSELLTTMGKVKTLDENITTVALESRNLSVFVENDVADLRREINESGSLILAQTMDEVDNISKSFEELIADVRNLNGNADKFDKRISYVDGYLLQVSNNSDEIRKLNKRRLLNEETISYLESNVSKLETDLFITNESLSDVKFNSVKHEANLKTIEEVLVKHETVLSRTQNEIHNLTRTQLLLENHTEISQKTIVESLKRENKEILTKLLRVNNTVDENISRLISDMANITKTCRNDNVIVLSSALSAVNESKVKINQRLKRLSDNVIHLEIKANATDVLSDQVGDISNNLENAINDVKQVLLESVTKKQTDEIIAKTISNITNDVTLLRRNIKRMQEAWRTSHTHYNRTIRTLINDTDLNSASIDSILAAVTGKSFHSKNMSERVDFLMKQQLENVEAQQDIKTKISLLMENTLQNEEEVDESLIMITNRLSEHDEKLLQLKHMKNDSQKLRNMVENHSQKLSSLSDDVRRNSNTTDDLKRIDKKWLLRHNAQTIYLTEVEKQLTGLDVKSNTVSMYMAGNSTLIRNLTDELNSRSRSIDENAITIEKIGNKIFNMTEKIATHSSGISNIDLQLSNMEESIRQLEESDNQILEQTLAEVKKMENRTTTKLAALEENVISLLIRSDQIKELENTFDLVLKQLNVHKESIDSLERSGDLCNASIQNVERNLTQLDSRARKSDDLMLQNKAQLMEKIFHVLNLTYLNTNTINSVLENATKAEKLLSNTNLKLESFIDKQKETESLRIMTASEVSKSLEDLRSNFSYIIERTTKTERHFYQELLQLNTSILYIDDKTDQEISNMSSKTLDKIKRLETGLYQKWMLHNVTITSLVNQMTEVNILVLQKIEVLSKEMNNITETIGSLQNASIVRRKEINDISDRRITNVTEHLRYMGRELDRLREYWSFAHANHNNSIHSLKNGSSLNSANIKALLKKFAGNNLHSSNLTEKVDLMFLELLQLKEDQVDIDARIIHVFNKTMQNKETIEDNWSHFSSLVIRNDESITALNESQISLDQTYEVLNQEFADMFRNVTSLGSHVDQINTAFVKDTTIYKEEFISFKNLTMLEVEMNSVKLSEDRLLILNITDEVNKIYVDQKEYKNNMETEVSQMLGNFRSISSNMSERLTKTELHLSGKMLRINSSILDMHAKHDNELQSLWRKTSETLNRSEAELNRKFSLHNESITSLISQNSELLWMKLHNFTEMIELLQNEADIRKGLIDINDQRIINVTDTSADIENQLNRLKESWSFAHAIQNKSIHSVKNGSALNSANIKSLLEKLVGNNLHSSNLTEKVDLMFLELLQLKDDRDNIHERIIHVFNKTMQNEETIENNWLTTSNIFPKIVNNAKNIEALQSCQIASDQTFEVLNQSLLKMSQNLTSLENYVDELNKTFSKSEMIQDQKLHSLENDTTFAIRLHFEMLSENRLSITNIIEKVDNFTVDQMEYKKVMETEAAQSLEDLKSNLSYVIERMIKTDYTFTKGILQLNSSILHIKENNDRELKSLLSRTQDMLDSSEAKIKHRILLHNETINWLMKQTTEIHKVLPQNIEVLSRKLYNVTETIGLLQNASAMTEEITDLRFMNVTKQLANTDRQISRLRESWSFAHAKHNKSIHSLKNGSEFISENIKTLLKKFVGNNLHSSNLTEKVDLMLLEFLQLKEDQDDIESKMIHLFNKTIQIEETMEDNWSNFSPQITSNTKNIAALQKSHITLGQDYDFLNQSFVKVFQNVTSLKRDVNELSTSFTEDKMNQNEKFLTLKNLTLSNIEANSNKLFENDLLLSYITEKIDNITVDHKQYGISVKTKMTDVLARILQNENEIYNTSIKVSKTDSLIGQLHASLRSDIKRIEVTSRARDDDIFQQTLRSFRNIEYITSQRFSNQANSISLLHSDVKTIEEKHDKQNTAIMANAEDISHLRAFRISFNKAMKNLTTSLLNLTKEGTEKTESLCEETKLLFSESQRKLTSYFANLKTNISTNVLSILDLSNTVAKMRNNSKTHIRLLKMLNNDTQSSEPSNDSDVTSKLLFTLVQKIKQQQQIAKNMSITTSLESEISRNELQIVSEKVKDLYLNATRSDTLLLSLNDEVVMMKSQIAEHVDDYRNLNNLTNKISSQYKALDAFTTESELNASKFENTLANINQTLQNYYHDCSTSIQNVTDELERMNLSVVHLELRTSNQSQKLEDGENRITELSKHNKNLQSSLSLLQDDLRTTRRHVKLINDSVEEQATKLNQSQTETKLIGHNLEKFEDRLEIASSNFNTTVNEMESALTNIRQFIEIGKEENFAIKSRLDLQQRGQQRFSNTLVEYSELQRSLSGTVTALGDKVTSVEKQTTDCLHSTKKNGNELKSQETLTRDSALSIEQLKNKISILMEFHHGEIANLVDSKTNATSSSYGTILKKLDHVYESLTRLNASAWDMLKNNPGSSSYDSKLDPGSSSYDSKLNPDYDDYYNYPTDDVTAESIFDEDMGTTMESQQSLHLLSNLTFFVQQLENAFLYVLPTSTLMLQDIELNQSNLTRRLDNAEIDLMNVKEIQKNLTTKKEGKTPLDEFSASNHSHDDIMRTLNGFRNGLVDTNQRINQINDYLDQKLPQVDSNIIFESQRVSLLENVLTTMETDVLNVEGITLRLNQSMEELKKSRYGDIESNKLLRSNISNMQSTLNTHDKILTKIEKTMEKQRNSATGLMMTQLDLMTSLNATLENYDVEIELLKRGSERRDGLIINSEKSLRRNKMDITELQKSKQNTALMLQAITEENKWNGNQIDTCIQNLHILDEKYSGNMKSFEQSLQNNTADIDNIIKETVIISASVENLKNIASRLPAGTSGKSSDTTIRPVTGHQSPPTVVSSPTNFSATSITPTSLLITWTPSSSHIRQYKITLDELSDQKMNGSSLMEAYIEGTQAVAEDLTQDTVYLISVYAVDGKVLSKPLSGIAKTDADLPASSAITISTIQPTPSISGHIGQTTELGIKGSQILWQCDFETPCTTLLQSATDNFDWTTHSGMTSSEETGPSSDHTRGDANGFYIYAEASQPRQTGDSARVGTNLFSPITDGCLEFYYHMFGVGAGDISVLLYEVSGHSQLLWSKSGNQGNLWQKGEIELHSDEKYRIIFEAIRGSDFHGDLALDDIVLKRGRCPRPAFECDFEQPKICGFVQDDSDDFDWDRHKGATSSSDTGPVTDHTSGMTGYYMFMEASNPRILNERARLISPELSGSDAQCLQFFYHMHGVDVKTLNVYSKKFSTGSDLNDLLWTKTGPQGNDWNAARVTINSATSYKIVFEVIRGSDFHGDIAIDDVSVQNGACRRPICLMGERFENLCYEIHNETKTYEDASNVCRMSGGILTAVKTEAQQGFLKGLAHDNVDDFSMLWIGLNDRTREGYFQYSDDTPFTTSRTSFNAWSPSEPNDSGSDEDCVALDIAFKNRNWNDISCDIEIGFICQYSLFTG